MRRAMSAFLVVLGVMAPGLLRAHPHVFVDARVILSVDEADRLVAVKHVWTFDEAFSVFAVQGLDADGDGTYTREELAELAEVNVTSLSEFDFFSFLDQGEAPAAFSDPHDYWLAYEGERLTLHYTLPVAAPLDLAGTAARLDVYDPDFFVAFAFASPAAQIEGGSAACRLDVSGPPPLDADAAAQLAEIPPDGMVPEELQAFTEGLSNTIRIGCGADAFLAAEAVLPSVGLPTGGSADAVTTAAPSQVTSGPLARWSAVIAGQQARFYRALTGALKTFEETGGLLLIGLSFAYGVFHAAGPGHGKFVLSGYMLANEAQARRGIALAFLSSLAQAGTAVLLFAALALAIGATTAQLTGAAYLLERVSYALVALFGLWLVWRKLIQPAMAANGTGASLAHAHHGEHDCGHDPVHGAHCVHSHLPAAAALRQPLRWREAAGLIASIGIRPCSGAIIVLVFALAQGLLAVGVLSVLAMSLGTAITVSAIVLVTLFSKDLAVRLFGTESRRGYLAWRTLEGAAAVLVLAFGIMLLLGSFGARPPLV